MPITWRKKEEEYSIIVWHSTEPMDVLLQNASLNAEDFRIWNSFQSETRKREWLTVRKVLKLLLPSPVINSVYYDGNGKPHLNEKGFISISHSHDFIAVMTGDVSGIGIDIEVIHPRIKILSNKFLSEKEKSNMPHENQVEKLQVFWGAKEVLYKIHSIGGIEFIKDLFVHPFDYSESGSVLKASILKKGFEKDYKIHYEKTGNYMLAWAIDK